MSDSDDQKMKRREFFRGLLRTAALAGLGLAGGALAARAALPGNGGGAPLREQSCINRGICRGCQAFPDCGLPQALSAKDALKP